MCHALIFLWVLILDKLSASSEEVRKFKAIAVKMKKELGEAKEKVQ